MSSSIIPKDPAGGEVTVTPVELIAETAAA
jgi:hypothetical protein